MESECRWRVTVDDERELALIPTAKLRRKGGVVVAVAHAVIR